MIGSFCKVSGRVPQFTLLNKSLTIRHKIGKAENKKEKKNITDVFPHRRN